MKLALTSTEKLLESSLLESARPIEFDQYKALPREERIYMALMHPRHFQMTDAESSYLEMMKLAYSILVSCPNPLRARQLIKTIKPGVTLTAGEVLELISTTQKFYVQIESNNQQFERKLLRSRLLDLYERAVKAKDRKTELRVLVEIGKLDVQDDPEGKGPVVPELPNVVITYSQEDAEDAIIESRPEHDDYAEEEE